MTQYPSNFDLRILRDNRAWSKRLDIIQCRVWQRDLGWTEWKDVPVKKVDFGKESL